MIWHEKSYYRRKKGEVKAHRRILPRQSQGRLLEEVTSQLGTEVWAGIIQAQVRIGREKINHNPVRNV